jgi:hypothetical protein
VAATIGEAAIRRNILLVAARAYGERLRLAFVKWLREERKFETIWPRSAPDGRRVAPTRDDLIRGTV